MTSPTRLLSVKEVSTMFGVSTMTVYRLIHVEELRAFRVGRTLRVRERDAQAYLRNANTIGWERP